MMLSCACAGSLGPHTMALGQAAGEAAAPHHIHGAVERAPARYFGAYRHAGAIPTTHAKHSCTTQHQSGDLAL